MCQDKDRGGCPIPIEGETDTLDTFVDSSFYWLRYLMPQDSEEFISTERYHRPDLYVGGAEHACMHLIYARFVHMVLYDAGYVPDEEPFKKLIHQGTITSSGAKMSKSLGNAVDSSQYEPDALRMHLMFIGPYSEGGDWNGQSVVGTEKFIKRMSRWMSECGEDVIDTDALFIKLDDMIMKFKFNTAVAELMKFYNANKHLKMNKDSRSKIESIMQVFAPGFSVNKLPW